MSEKRKQLEEAATAAVQRSGLSNLSFRTLAEEVGIKSSSVHYHFPEKSHLATALIERYHESFADRLTAITTSPIGPASKIEQFIGIFEEALEADKFCLCGMLAAEVDTLTAENRLALANYFRHLEAWLVEVVSSSSRSEGRAGGAMLASGAVARLLLSGLEGALLLDRLQGGSTHLQAQKEFSALLFAGELRA